jgi:hypothetical protein
MSIRNRVLATVAILVGLVMGLGTAAFASTTGGGGNYPTPTPTVTTPLPTVTPTIPTVTPRCLIAWDFGNYFNQFGGPALNPFNFRRFDSWTLERLCFVRGVPTPTVSVLAGPYFFN